MVMARGLRPKRGEDVRQRLSFKDFHKRLAEYVPADDMPAEKTLWTWAQDKGPSPPFHLVPIMAYCLDATLEELTDEFALLKKPRDRRKGSDVEPRPKDPANPKQAG